MGGHTGIALVQTMGGGLAGSGPGARRREPLCLELALVLVVVAVEAEQLPVAAVRRVVIVVVVLVVDGELAQVLAVEGPPAPGTDPGVELQGLLAVVALARRLGLARLGHHLIQLARVHPFPHGWRCGPAARPSMLHL